MAGVKEKLFGRKKKNKRVKMAGDMIAFVSFPSRGFANFICLASNIIFFMFKFSIFNFTPNIR